MAKKSASNGTSAKVGEFELNLVKKDKAQERLTELRSGHPGRVSKYGPVLEWAKEQLEGSDDDFVSLKMSKNQVGGLRGYANRKFPDFFDITSATTKEDNDQYEVFIALAPPPEAEGESKEEAAEEQPEEEPAEA